MSDPSPLPTPIPLPDELREMREAIAAHIHARFVMARWDSDPAMPVLIEVVNAIRTFGRTIPQPKGGEA